MVGTTDANGGEQSSSYDGVDRLVRHVHRLGGVTEYSYDQLGCKVEECDKYGRPKLDKHGKPGLYEKGQAYEQAIHGKLYPEISP